MSARSFAAACTGALIVCLWLVSAGILMFASLAQSAPSARSVPTDPSEVHFAGEVTDGKLFEREVGRGLVFRLIPLGGDSAGGWVIEVAPRAQPADEAVEFSEVATPPFHFYNDRYLAGAYGYSTKEAAALTLRRFNFVLSVNDYRLAEEVVNSVLYPSTVSEDEKQRLASQAADIRLGRGELHILHAHVVLGKGGKPDAISLLKFEVTLNFSADLTLDAVLAPKPARAR